MNSLLFDLIASRVAESPLSRILEFMASKVFPVLELPVASS
jgi:hypothetical protein